MVEGALQVAERNVCIDTEAFNLVEDGRVGRVLGVVAMDLAGDHNAHRRRLQFHGAHLHGRGVSAQQEAVAQGATFLVGDDERVLGVARGMAGRKVHGLEVVEIGFDLRPDTDRVTQRSEDTCNFVECARDGVFCADKPLGTWQGDIDGLGGQRSVTRASAGGFIEEPLYEFLEGLEALADCFFGIGRRGFEPAAGDLIEKALLAAEPLEAERFDGVRAGEGRRVLAGLLSDCCEGIVERNRIESNQIGYWIVHHA